MAGKGKCQLMQPPTHFKDYRDLSIVSANIKETVVKPRKTKVIFNVLSV